LRLRLFRSVFNFAAVSSPDDIASESESAIVLQLLRMLAALSRAFFGQSRGQFVRELFKLRRKPSRQFIPHASAAAA